MALNINGETYNQMFKEVYGQYLNEDPFLTKIETIEASQKGYAQYPVDASIYDLQGCCSTPTDSAITLENCYVSCVSMAKTMCKADLNVLDKAVSVRAGEGTTGSGGESLMKELAANFKNGLSTLAANGNTGLGVEGLLALSKGTETGSKTNIFDAVLAGFAAMPSNSLGKVGVLLSPKNFNKLKIESLKKNLYVFNGLDISNTFVFPGLDIECVSMNGMPDDKIVVTPYANVIRFAGRIDDDDFVNTAFDSVGNVVFNISTLFGLAIKYPELSVVVSLT
jgi:hypothetical protein